MKNDTLGDISYQIDKENRTLYAKRCDGLSKSAIFAEWEAMQKLDGFDPTFDTIVDYGDVTVVDVNFNDIFEINAELPKRDPRTGNIAIVSGNNQGRYLLGKLFVEIANRFSKRKHNIFTNVDDAKMWITSLR